MDPTDPGYVSRADEYETGVKGKWRTESSFVYRTPISVRNTTDPTKPAGFNSTAGKFDAPLFNWELPKANGDKWVLTTTTTRYSPNGEPLEDTNILNI